LGEGRSLRLTSRIGIIEAQQTKGGEESAASPKSRKRAARKEFSGESKLDRSRFENTREGKNGRLINERGGENKKSIN